MTSKTKAFLEELLDLCLTHGVRIVDTDNFDSEDQFCGTTYHFEGKKPEDRIEMADVFKAAEKANQEAKQPKPMLIWRENEAKKRQWLVDLAKEEILWSNKRESAKVQNLTLAQYMRLMSRLEKTDIKFRYLFGHEEAK